jgi:hypothetical protein
MTLPELKSHIAAIDSLARTAHRSLVSDEAEDEEAELENLAHFWQMLLVLLRHRIELEAKHTIH